MKIEICTTIELEMMSIEAAIFFDYQPGEPEVRYYADGSGYPGAPPTCEFIGICTEAVEGDGYKVDGISHPDWFELLDDIVCGMIESNKDGLRDRLEEDAVYEWEDAYEDF